MFRTRSGWLHTPVAPGQREEDPKLGPTWATQPFGEACLKRKHFKNGKDTQHKGPGLNHQNHKKAVSIAQGKINHQRCGNKKWQGVLRSQDDHH